MNKPNAQPGPHVLSILVAVAAVAFVATAPGLSGAADPLLRQYFTDDRGMLRGYSGAVTTEGGTIVWLAGQTVVADADGNSIRGDFAAQTHEIFRRLGERLEVVGGSLADVVTMTVYVKDPRHADDFVDIRRQYFEPGRAPSSALINVVGFTRPGVLLEVKATAVVGDEA